MIDINALIAKIRADGTIATVMTDPARQFGVGNRVYLMAQLMPERTVRANVFRDDKIRYRRLIAVDGTRYSPVEVRNGALVGSVLVELGESQTGSQLTGQDLDALMELLEREAEPEAIAELTRFADETLNLPLAEKNELYRCQAVVDGQVLRIGSNGYRELVPFPNPPGSRTVAGGAWSDPNYDPLPDILAHVTRMSANGFSMEGGAIVGSTRVRNILLNNPKMRARMGGAMVLPTGAIQSIPMGASAADLNALLEREGLPPLQTYDLQYATNSGTQRFFPNNALALFAGTGRNEAIDLGDGDVETVENVIGYVAVGRPAAQPAPGRVALVEYDPHKPASVKGEAYQTSFPVINEPDAIGVITGIN